MSEAKAPDESAVDQLNFKDGDYVQEFGYDDDVDFEFREELEDGLGSEVLTEDDQDVVDGVILWWREDDGDLTDALVDATQDVAEGGSVWLLTPKVGRDGYVDPADIKEATVTAGLALANAASVSEDWQAQKIVRPKHSRR